MMTNEEILAILRQYPDLVPEVLAILTLSLIHISEPTRRS